MLNPFWSDNYYLVKIHQVYEFGIFIVSSFSSTVITGSTLTSNLSYLNCFHSALLFLTHFFSCKKIFKYIFEYDMKV